MSTDPTQQDQFQQAPSPAGGPVAPGPGEAVAEIPSTPDDRTMALLAHLGGIIAGFIVPLVIWLVKKDSSRFVEDQAKEALNFQLTILIVYLISVPLSCVFIGYFTFLAAWVLAIVFSIIAAMEANKGKVYRYPLTLRFIK